MAENVLLTDELSARLLTMINANWMTQTIATAAALDIPVRLVEGPQSGAALAAAASCHEASLLRRMHALVSLGLCVERADGRFEVTAMGTLLDPATPGTLHHCARARVTRWADWGELERSVRSGQCYRLRHCGSEDFSRLDNDPPAAAMFHRAMVDLTSRVVIDAVNAIKFRGDEHVVDVGGGSGTLLTALLAANPGLRGTVVDLAHAQTGAIEHFDLCGMADRCAFVAANFFERPPPQADVYLLKSVLHNWDDERAAIILRRC